MNGEYGLWQQGGIEGVRVAHPVVMSQAGEVQIPFSSKIKFNMMVRDNDPSKTNPANEKENMTLYLKGAPERVINRCSTLLMNIDEHGNETEVPINDLIKKKINIANEKFGGSGERVLAFSKRVLNPKTFPKNPMYNFDVKSWASWEQSVKETPINSFANGQFPMHNL